MSDGSQFSQFQEATRFALKVEEFSPPLLALKPVKRKLCSVVDGKCEKPQTFLVIQRRRSLAQTNRISQLPVDILKIPRHRRFRCFSSIRLKTIYPPMTSAIDENPPSRRSTQFRLIIEWHHLSGLTASEQCHSIPLPSSKFPAGI
jgi:hypothetical protein